jgi:quercetin dioxygenase-like cupin family protein
MQSISVTKFNDAPVVMPAPEGRRMFSSDRLTLIHLTLKPGETVAPHDNPDYVTFYVLSGTGTLEAGEETLSAEDGTCVGIPTGIIRGWKNNSDKELRLLVLKIPA